MTTHYPPAPSEVNRIREARRSAAATKGRPLGDLEPHPNPAWHTIDGRAVQLGATALIGNRLNRGIILDHADVYLVDDAGEPVAAAAYVSASELREWDTRQTAAGEQAEQNRQRRAADEAEWAEQVASADRDYLIATTPGGRFPHGVNIDDLRSQAEAAGVRIDVTRAGRVVVSIPAGRPPFSTHVAMLRSRAAALADLCCRWADHLAADNPRCDVPRCTRRGHWITDSGAIVCHRHARRPAPADDNGD